MHSSVMGWRLNWASLRPVCACLWYRLKFNFSCHVCSNDFSFCLLRIQGKLKTCVFNRTGRQFPSVPHRSLPPCSPLRSLTHKHTPSFCFPFDFIYCSRSVLIYLCSFTSHSDNLPPCLSALSLYADPIQLVCSWWLLLSLRAVFYFLQWYMWNNNLWIGFSLHCISLCSSGFLCMFPVSCFEWTFVAFKLKT